MTFVIQHQMIPPGRSLTLGSAVVQSTKPCATLAPSRRRVPFDGFTLLDLLIALAIMSLLISLSVPAVQAAREAARRTQCQNNDREFGIAFHSLESDQGAFPAGFTAWFKGPLTIDPQVRLHNFIVDLLPYVGGNAIDQNYDRNAMFFATQNAEAIATPLGISICPSAPDREVAPPNRFVPSLLARPTVTRQTGLTSAVFQVLDKKYSGSYNGALTDYSVVVMADDRLARSLGYTIKGSLSELPSLFPLPSGEKLISEIVPLLVGSGEVTIAERMRASQVTDGLSNTFMLTEVAGRPERWQMGVHTGVKEPLPSAWADPLILISLRQIQSPNGKCLMNCDNDANIYSFHSGGVNFLFADGRAEFLVRNIDPRVLVALMTPDQSDGAR